MLDSSHKNKNTNLNRISNIKTYIIKSNVLNKEYKSNYFNKINLNTTTNKMIKNKSLSSHSIINYMSYSANNKHLKLNKSNVNKIINDNLDISNNNSNIKQKKRNFSFDKNTYYDNNTFLLPSQEELNLGKKTLVLDLDETLVHSRFNEIGKSDYKINIKSDDDEVLTIYVLIRPYAIEFLKILCKYYEIVIFTASMNDVRKHKLM